METTARLRELAHEMKQRPLTVDELRELSRLLSAEGRDDESKAAWAKAERHAARERIAYLTYKDHQATADEWLEVAALHRQLGQADQAATAEATAAQLQSSQRQDFGRETRAPAPPPAASVWGPLPSGKRLLTVGCGTLAVCIGFLCMLAISDASSSSRSTTATTSTPEMPPHPSADQVQAGIDRSLPALQQAMAQGGGSITGRAELHRAMVDVTVPLMSEPEAKEIALMVMHRLDVPAGTTMVIKVTSPAGQELATVIDGRY